MENYEYMLTSDGELYHWKYIKREKVNGKWVYTYDKPGSNVKTKSTTVKDTDKLGSSKSTVTVNGNKHVTYNRGKLERFVDTAKNKLGIKDHFDNRTKDWYESKDRATEKAAKKAKADGAKLIDTDKFHSSVTKISFGSDVIYKAYNRGEFERYTATAKEYLKDRLGFDELDAYGETLRKSKSKQSELDNYKKYRDKEFDNATVIDDKDGNYRREYRSEGYKEHMAEIDAEYKKKQKAADDARNAHYKAVGDFYKTPIGKLQRVDDNVDRARTWLANTLEKSAERAANRLKKRNRKTGILDKQWWY